VSEVFAIELERWVYRPGDVVRGRITVRLAHDTRALTAALAYVENSGSVEGVAEEVRTPPLFGGELAPGQQLEFALALPPGAKPAFVRRFDQPLGPDGEHSLVWEVQVKSDKRGFDKHASARFDVVAPGTDLSAPPAAATPEGWHPDPWGQARLRWWDGRQWTGHTAP
jgi:hypothetical protein